MTRGGHDLGVSPVRGVRIAAVSSYAPGRPVSSSEIASLTGVPAGWIEKRTGIEQRYYSDAGLLEISSRAAESVLSLSEVDRGSVGLVILASSSLNRTVPPIAPELAARVGITGAGAFDMNAACAGSSYGIELARSAISAGVCDTALVVGAESFSPFLDMSYRNTAVVFGDGAGAVLMEVDDSNAVAPAVWTSDGGSAGLLSQSHVLEEIARGTNERLTYEMDGQGVYRWVRANISDLCRRTLNSAGFDLGDLEVLILHQANRVMLDCVIDQLELGNCLIPQTIDRFGNTSAASVFQVMAEGVRRGGSGKLALAVGFGAGMTACAQVFRMPSIAVVNTDDAPVEKIDAGERTGPDNATSVSMP